MNRRYLKKKIFRMKMNKNERNGIVLNISEDL